jgi:hypothetical protein
MPGRFISFPGSTHITAAINIDRLSAYIAVLRQHDNHLCHLLGHAKTFNRDQVGSPPWLVSPSANVN